MGSCNNVHLLWTILTFDMVDCLVNFQGLMLIFDFPLRATRGQLSTPNLPGGGSEGFNQRTEDVVEERGERRPHCSHALLHRNTPAAE